MTETFLGRTLSVRRLEVMNWSVINTANIWYNAHKYSRARDISMVTHVSCTIRMLCTEKLRAEDAYHM